MNTEKAIDLLDNLIGMVDDNQNNDYDTALHMAIDALKKQEWIPVSERLPEGKHEVLVTEYGETDIGRRFNGRWLDLYGDKMKDVTAWMEKPEPYKGEHHE